MGDMDAFSSKLLLLLVIVHVHVRPSLEDPSCNATERELLANAFAFVSGFQLSLLLQNSTGGAGESCSAATEIRLPSRNLKGTVSWKLLREVSGLRVLDLSGNSLSGSIPVGFWSSLNLAELNLAGNRLGGPVGSDELSGRPSSSLVLLNLSGNRFTNSIRLSGFPRLRFLDLSGNNLRMWPAGLAGLTQLKFLDISRCNISGESKSFANLSSLEHFDISLNRISGSFPADLPPLGGLKFLNVSFNNFTGRVAAEYLRKFGAGAFVHAGVDVLSDNGTTTSASSPSSFPEDCMKEMKRSHGKTRQSSLVLGLCLSAVFLSVFAVVAIWLRRKPCHAAKRNKELTFSTEGAAAPPPWVAEIIASGSPEAEAPVVIFEKPLLHLNFLELVAATSGFGEESRLAEGWRGGAVYRAVLPGEIDVVIKLLSCSRTADLPAAKAMFEELGRLKHPNILPLLGFCITGREKLLLYDYMENGDLRRWLQELPISGRLNADWCGEDWENPGGEGESFSFQENTAMGWETRHRIALGIARGLAFLHHAGSKPVVHGHLVPSNVILDDDFEPRIADFGTGGAATLEDDVFCYGLILLELLTGKETSPTVLAAVRRVVRGKGAERCLDSRLRLRSGDSDADRAEEEMVEALRVALLCAAESPERRPTMRQVVGLIKDIRPSTLVR